MVREGRVIISGPGTRPAFGVGYYVQALEVGAQVTEASSGVTATVAAGHGLAADDKVIVNLDIQQYRIVESVTATEIVFTESVSLAAGDFIVNLAQDTGSIQPNYDGDGLTVYTDMDYQNVAITNTVLTDSNGRYRYFHQGVPRWELVRSASGPVAIYMDDAEQLVAEVFAHHYADSGDGSENSPWALTDSNPVQAALDALPATGGTVRMVAGHYTLGAADEAVVIPILEDADDFRTYRLIGDSRDLTILNYSGTGTAISYDQATTGEAFSSIQSNQLVLKGFALRQTGTTRTGIGIGGNFVSESLFEDLTIGNPRLNRHSSVDPDDWGFEYGIKFATDDVFGEGEVSDFNRFHRLYMMGNTHAIYLQNQADNTVISESSFEPRQLIGVEQDGVQINNSGGTSVTGCHFNAFNNSSTSFGLKISSACNGCNISGNYFEYNSVSIKLLPGSNAGGYNISGNMFTFANASGESIIAIDAGVTDSVWELHGLHIHGNAFYVLTTTNIGVVIRNSVRGFVLGPNFYDLEGGGSAGTPYTLADGCRGILTETNANGFPIVHVIESAQDSGRIILENTSADPERSPQIQYLPGGGGDSYSSVVSAAGHFQLLSADGFAKIDIDQDGNSIHYPIGPANTTTAVRGAVTELLTIAAAATTDTTIDLPANSVIDAVVGRVVTVIPTAATFSVGDPTTAARFGSGIAVAANTTFVGIPLVNGSGVTGNPTQITAAKVRITPNSTPGAATGQVRIVIYYTRFTVPSA